MTETDLFDKRTFAEYEKQCESNFSSNGPFWHLTTPGQNQEIIFTTAEEYKQGITMIAVCAAIHTVRILAFELMSNHVHFIMSGTRQECLNFFQLFRQKLNRYLKSRQSKLSLTHFDVNDGPIPINSLNSLRNEIVYVHRNQYVVNQMITPYSDMWGTSYLYFCPLGFELGSKPFSALSIRQQKTILKGRAIKLPANYSYRDGYIQPSSFCCVKEGEQYFRNAHHYFTTLLKNYEAYSEIAKRLGDTVSIIDDEMYFAVTTICMNDFKVSSPGQLSPKDRLEVAKLMRSKYNATAAQIKRILKLDNALLSDLFSQTK